MQCVLKPNRASLLFGMVLISSSLAPGCLLFSTAAPCSVAEDCLSKNTCRDGRCVAAPDDDNGTPLENRDGGGADAGPGFDAGFVLDAGSADAGNADAGNADAGNADAGNADAGNADAGSLDPTQITTFNVEAVLQQDLSDLNFDGCVATIIVSVSGADVVWTTSNEDCEGALNTFVSRVVVVQEAGKVIFAGRNWVIPVGATLRLEGDKPIILFAENNLVIDGKVDASGYTSERGPATDREDGPGASFECIGKVGTAAGKEGGGGGGGGGGTVGGNGGSGKGGAAGGRGGDSISSVGQTELMGGCRGGDGAADDGSAGKGGAAGGATQLVALRTISGSGTVLANGGNGSPNLEKDAGGGGGSGGMVWFVSHTFAFDGAVVANGGAGAGGGGDNGNPAFYGALPALGRSAIGGAGSDVLPLLGQDLPTVVGNMEGPPGGAGGWRLPPTNGFDGHTNNTKSGGGGGGGAAGRIIIEVHNTCALLPATSPEAEIPLDGCNIIAAICGNGNVESAQGEVCDDGVNLLEEVGCGCANDCQIERKCLEQSNVIVVQDDAVVVDLGELPRSSSSDRVFVACDACDGVTGTLSSLTSAVIECREGNCDVACDDVEESCTVLCLGASTCSLSCNDVRGAGDACQMFCDDEAQCFYNTLCTDVGGGGEDCTIRPMTTLLNP